MVSVANLLIWRHICLLIEKWSYYCCIWSLSGWEWSFVLPREFHTLSNVSLSHKDHIRLDVCLLWSDTRLCARFKIFRSMFFPRKPINVKDLKHKNIFSGRSILVGLRSILVHSLVDLRIIFSSWSNNRLCVLLRC